MAIPGGSTSSNSVGEGSQKGWRKSRCTPSLNGSTTNPPSSTGSTDAACSISGAESLIGFVPENEIDHELETKKLDLELVEDLARFDEAGLLEELLFECFSNVNAVVNTFAELLKMMRFLQAQSFQLNTSLTTIVKIMNVL